MFDQLVTKPPRDPGDKPKDLPPDKASVAGSEGSREEGSSVVVVVAAAGGAPTPAGAVPPASASKPSSPGVPSPSAPDQKRAGPDVTSQGVQTTTATTPTFGGGPKPEDKEEKKEAVQE